MNTQDTSLNKIENIAAKIMQEKYLGRAYLDRQQKNDMIYYYFTSNNEQISIQSLVSDVDSYLKGGTPVVLDVRDYLVKRKTFVRFLAKEKIEDPLLGKLFNTLLNPPSFNIHLDTLNVAFNINEKFAKVMALKICDSYTSRQFKTRDVQHCHLLIKEFLKLDFQESEYPSLHHFFNYYKEAIIAHPHQMQEEVANFLKTKINYKYWDDFAQYCPTDAGFKKVKDNSLPMVEINLNPTYNLIINDDSIRLKHPLISSQTDIKKMMDSLVKLVNKNCDKLGLSKAFYSDWTDKQTFIYLTAKSPDSANINNIEKMFFSLIDSYASRFMNQTKITESDIDKIFQYSYMESSLQDKLEPTTIKRKI
jgi:hypothetical protein